MDHRRLQRRVGTSLIVISTVGLLVIMGPYAIANARYQLDQWVGPLTPHTDYGPVVRADGQPETISSSPAPTSPVSQPTGPILEIPKLDIHAPIVENVDGVSQYAYNTALKHGVAQMKGTAALDAVTGNSFIFGHSSRFAPSGTPYDAVFATLPKLRQGDMLTLVTTHGTYQFTVTQSSSTGPNDLSVLNQTNDRVVTLETCWPLGTTAKRWVVRATASS